MPWLKNRWFKYVLHGIGSFSAASGWKIYESSIKECLQRITKYRYEVAKNYSRPEVGFCLSDG